MSKKAFGILIIHGFSDRLDSIRILETALAGLDFPIETPVLRGHGAESPDALKGVTWEDWVADAKSALFALQQKAEKVIVIGFSLGGLIALNLAAENPEKIDSMILAATPIQTTSFLVLDRLLLFLMPIVKKLVKKWDVPPTYADKERIQYHTSYPWVPIDSIAELLDLLIVAHTYLPKIDLPTLILQSTNDTTASPKSARIIYDTISTPPEQKEIVWFEKTEHELFRDLEREAVVDAIVNYVRGRVGK